MARTILNRSIVIRLAILCLIPLLALVVVSGNKIFQEYKRVGETTFVENVFQVAPHMSALIHELQKERGRSAGFIGSKGKAFTETLSKGRLETDEKLKMFREMVPAPSGRLARKEYAEPYQKAVASLQKLKEMRGKVDNFELTVPEMAKFYTPIIWNLIASIKSLTLVIEEPESLRHAFSYVALLEGKERAGIERAMGAAGFGSGNFAPKVYQRFVRLDALQEAFFATFKKYATPENREFFNETLKGPVQENVLKLRQTALQNPFGGSLGDVTGPDWFKTSTARIDVLKTIEDHVASNISQEISVIGDRAATVLWTMVGILIVLIAIVTGLSFFVYRSIVPPMAQLVGDMKQLAQNNVEIEIDNTWRGDEIGDMARAVDVFKANAKERIKLEDRATEENEKERQRQMHIDGIVKDFREKINGSLSTVVDQTNDINETSSHLKDIANSATAEATSAKSATEHASQDVQIVASAAEELSSSIKEIEEQTQRANEAMGAAATRAQQTDQDVSQLASAAGQIGDVLNLIRDIAERTNLLALNATIEAARAGEAGRGFAIVAQEVKSLANQTAQATEEISGQITGIQSSTENAVDSIRHIISAVSDMQVLTESVSASVSQQREATQEIANSVASASNGTNTVTESVGLVTNSIQITSEQADNVQGATSLMASVTDELKTQIEDFLHNVTTDVTERRRALRVKMRELVVVHSDGRRLYSTVQDCSKTGAAIDPVDEVEVGHSITIVFSNNKTISGEVVRQGENLLGVKFDDEIKNFEDFIEDLMNQPEDA